MTASGCWWPELLLTKHQLLTGSWSDSVEPSAKSGSQEQSSWQGVLEDLPSNKPSPPCMFRMFDRPWSTTKGWQGVLGVPCCGTPPRHCWVLRPLASRGVPSHHFPGTRLSCLLLAPSWLYTMLGWEYIHVGLSLLATSGCRGPPPLKLLTAPANNVGRKGKGVSFLMTVLGKPSG